MTKPPLTMQEKMAERRYVGKSAKDIKPLPKAKVSIKGKVAVK